MPEQPPPAECGNCGAAIPPSASACPECGADERTGWREGSVYDGVDLPDDAFDEPENAAPTAPKVNGLAWYWWAAAVCLLLLVLSAFVFP